MFKIPEHIDMHMHTLASDGTDAPEELLGKIKAAGIGLFAISDHDAVKNCAAMRELLQPGDPTFINGVEFSCSDEKGKYHILGYAYDINGQEILSAVQRTHEMRIGKVQKRLDFIAEQFGFTFPQEELDALWALNNPGKPHIGLLMVKYGYAPDKNTAIEKYIDLCKVGGSVYIRPEDAIAAILASGGIPVLAHPVYGSGSQLLDMDEMNDRVRRLKAYGLQGMECYYSGFSRLQQRQMLELAERYDLYVSAGSDYHGNNKLIELGDTNLANTADAPERLHALLRECVARSPKL